MIKNTARTKNTVIAILLVLAVFLSSLTILNSSETAFANTSAWDGTVATSFAGGSGTEEDPYQIATAEQLALLASIVNVSNSDYADKYYIQTADIILNDSSISGWTSSAYSWTPIGITNISTAATYSFSGSFDGQGYDITGVYIPYSNTGSAGYGYGLFGIIDGAVIANVHIDGYIYEYMIVGGIVGKATDSLIYNCSNDATIRTVEGYCGGIVGSSSTTDIINCTNSGSLNCGTMYAGGIVGTFSSGSIENSYNYGYIDVDVSYSGGIAGSLSSSEIINSYNSGSISYASSDYNGFLVGKCTSSSITNSFYLAGSSSVSIVGSGSATYYGYSSFDTSGDLNTTVNSCTTLLEALNSYADTDDSYLAWNAADGDYSGEAFATLDYDSLVTYVEPEITNISDISTTLLTEGDEITVSFTYDEVGDVGDLEFIWYVNNIGYKVTDTSSLTISNISTGVYGVYCEIVSSKDFSVTTSDFELRVNPSTEITYILITEQPASFTMKVGEPVVIYLDCDDLDCDNITSVVWYVNGSVDSTNLTEFDLSELPVGEYEIYCDYVEDYILATSDVVTVSIVGDVEADLSEEVESAWDNLSTGFWVAIGATIAAALVAILVALKKN